MVRQINDIEFIVTDNEVEALTLESNLIKSNQPYFNVLLKDDKKYPYVCITWSEDYPRLFITRRRRSRRVKDRYYGPFVDVNQLRMSLNTIKSHFSLRQRKTPLYKDRPCLNYSIGKCPGVCQKLISSKDYHKTIEKVAMVFQGRVNELSDMLRKQMMSYSNNEEFEKAAKVRDQMKAIEYLSEEQKMISPDSTISRDVIAIKQNKKISTIQIFQIRSGKLVGRLGYIDSASKLEKDLLMQKVIESHYSFVDPIEIPQEICLDSGIPQNQLMSEWLTELRGRKVTLTVPKRSEKASLVELVKRNAQIELLRIEKGHERTELSLEDLTSLLELTKIPRRIECFDISHMQGSDPVASQVVFVDGIPAKHLYRKYKIRSSHVYAGHSDDYVSLSEVIRRRFRKWSRLKAEGANIEDFSRLKASSLNLNSLDDWPDIVVIDGGKGQLSSVMKTLKQMDLDNELFVCSLAKKKEELFLPGALKPVISEPEQLGMLLLRRVRDEAHRFAISFHRDQRSIRMKKSNLNQIPGIGPTKTRDLLAHFNSIEAIQLATSKELAKAPGIGAYAAEQIWKYFHG